MAYTIKPSDDFRIISKDEFFYYYEEAIQPVKILANIDDGRPMVYGAVALLQLTTRPGFWKCGLARVVVDRMPPTRGFNTGFTITVLDTDRKAVKDSTETVYFKKDRSLFLAVGQKALLSYQEQYADLSPATYNAIRGFFISEPNVIKHP